MKLYKHGFLALLITIALQPIMASADEKDPTKAPENVKAAPKEADVSKSGLASMVIRKGTGTEKPEAHDEVEVHYAGWTTDGELFDASYKRGSTTSFPLNGVIKGWTEGVQLMVEGEKRRFWIPADLAYGENPGGGRPGGTLVFDIELVSITNRPAPPKTPENLTKAPDDAKKEESGLASIVLTKGSGEEKPEADNIASLHLVGWTTEGQLIINTQEMGAPMKLPLEDAPLKGWSEAAQLMVKGEKRRIWVPEALAGAGNPRAPQGDLVFDIELVDFQAPIPPPAAPEDVAKAPEDAEKTDSGLASKVLKKGTGTEHPTEASHVEVHYSGWTTDGELFDSSVVRGEPTGFPLGGVIKGWTEGVQLMVVGEKRRFWIPADLAYGDNPRGGAPGGTLVFDIELLEIK